MKEKIDLLLNEYLKDNSRLVDSSKDYYLEFVKNVPKELYKYFNENEYLIKASIGTGQKSEIPWLCIFNRKITTSAISGIYICYLFKSDMSGFYLALGQGITAFAQLYGSAKYDNIKRIAEYFRELINDTKFSRDDIDLKGKKGLAKGYEAGTIISKYYKKNNYSEKELIDDLIAIKNIYDDIYENMRGFSYVNIIDDVLKDKEDIYIITENPKEMVIRENIRSRIPVLEQVDIPRYKKKDKYTKVIKRVGRKINYIKKAESSIRNGLLGEELVIAYEKQRLIDLGMEELIKNIKWVSKDDDEKGYDIISFDIGKDGNVQKRYIEVKSTEENGVSDFYISSNEVRVMEKLKKRYFIYRVYNVNDDNPKVFILSYNDFKNRINLSVEGYIAKMKEDESDNYE